MNEYIARWGALVGFDDATDRSDLIGLFQHFRPDGSAVESIFAGQPFGEVILDRVRRCYQCTRSGFRETDPYFIPRPEESCAESEAREVLSQHFLEMQKLAERAQDSELIEILSNVSPARVASQGELNQLPLNDDSPDGWIYDLVTNFLCSLSPKDSPFLLLNDAMYSIANNRFVRDYLLWPLYKEAFKNGEPFLPAFELWSKGVSFSFRRSDSCRFFIYPGLNSATG